MLKDLNWKLQFLLQQSSQTLNSIKEMITYILHDFLKESGTMGTRKSCCFKGLSKTTYAFAPYMIEYILFFSEAFQNLKESVLHLFLFFAPY